MNQLSRTFAIAGFCAVVAPSVARAQTRVDWDPRPSLRVNDDVRIDFRLKLQGDLRVSSPDQPGTDDLFLLRRRRVGVEGTLFDRITFQIEKELRHDGPWRDVYVNVEAADPFELRVGKFKQPFGLEETTSTTDLDFVYRTLGSDSLAPSRSVGVMAHGRPNRLLEYEAGVFRDDGENARFTEPLFTLPDEEEATRERAFAARVIVTPWGRGGGSRPRLGAALTAGTVPEGLNSLRGRTVFDTVFMPRVFVNGDRLRTGVEGEWNPGRLGFRAEFIRVVDERRGQGLGDVDLSDYIGRSWYASASWVVTGEEKAGGVRPSRSLFAGGFGAVEVATRFESLKFDSGSHEGPAFTNPRADHVASNEARVWTSGVNWYLNRWVRVFGNGIRETFEDAARSPVPGEAAIWSLVMRLQVVL
jgi:phosphate-selective porin OprO/OprP